MKTVGCAGVSSYGKVGVVRWLPSLIFAHTHTFRKANDTITTMSLESNNIGEAGATALAESLKATLVTCVLQVRASPFPWQVCARTHRRRSAT